MATLILKTVKPSGGDYTSLVTALADIPLDFVAADEQWTIEVYKKAGGYAESATVPSATCDATRFLEIKAAAGDEYIRHDGSGAFFSAAVGFAGVLNATTADYLRVLNIGFINTRTAANSRGVQISADNSTIDGVFARSDATSGASCYLLSNSYGLNITNSLAEGGTIGFDFGNNNVRNGENLTAVKNITSGFSTGTANTTLKNCLYIDSGSGFVGTFNASSDYNASSDATAPGTNSLQNRTSADLVDYVGGDYRTSSSSVLSTAGVGGTFIGYDVDVSTGITVTGVTANYDYLGVSGQIELTPEIVVTGSTASYNYQAIQGQIQLTPEIIVTGSTANYDYFGVDGIVSFSGEIIVTGDTANYEYLPVDGVVTLQGDIIINGDTANYDYSTINGTISLIGALTVNPKNTIRVVRKSNSIKVNRKNNILKVK